MGNSLQDQLLKAGLVDKERVQKANSQKKKQTRKKRKTKNATPSPEEIQRKKAQAEKAERDRELNQRRDEARRQREIAAEIKQLVDRNRHRRTESEEDTPFYFENKGKIKSLYVSSETHDLISAGKLMIVNCNGVFDLVPPDIAEKIRSRNPSLVIDLPKEESTKEDDPYAEHKVPDDLMW